MISLVQLSILALWLPASTAAPLINRDVGLWPDSFLTSVANRAAELASANQAAVAVRLAESPTTTSPTSDPADESPDDGDTSAVNEIGSLALTTLYNPTGLSTSLDMTGVNTPTVFTFADGTLERGAFGSSGWQWQASGLFQYGGCDISTASIISNCFNMQLSADPTQHLESTTTNRQRIEILTTGAEPGTTWSFSWKSASPNDTASTDHFFHTWQILSRGGDAASGPVVMLDFIKGSAAIRDTVRCGGSVCGGNGQGVALSTWEARVISHSMLVTFGPSGSIQYRAVDAMTNATMISYDATGSMGGTNPSSLKFGLYRPAMAGMSSARAFIGDFSGVQISGPTTASSDSNSNSADASATSYGVPDMTASAAPVDASPSTSTVTGSGSTFSGTATWFKVGLGACGGQNVDTDLIVAVNSAQYASGAWCGKHVLITSGGTTVTATVADECPTCFQGDLDLSPATFQHFATLETGVQPITWDFAS